uniref:BTB domain-containing protein n=1 Tax=Ciona savignyi TaxID=51511 RepID=H2YKQ0_CIOSA
MKRGADKKIHFAGPSIAELDHSSISASITYPLKKKLCYAISAPSVPHPEPDRRSQRLDKQQNDDRKPTQRSPDIVVKSSHSTRIHHTPTAGKNIRHQIPTHEHQSSLPGTPKAAVPSRYAAPVHIDVGGHIYTSSLETLTQFPSSKLGRLFNGSEPIVLDTLKQHYFIDRDGNMFRHILNFLRTSKLALPDDFHELDQLIQEARFFELKLMIEQLEDFKERRDVSKTHKDCVVIRTMPDLGERICLGGSKHIIASIFPEVADVITSADNCTWNHNSTHVIRFPLNAFCNLNSIQVLERFLSSGFSVLAGSGGGSESSSHFSEWVVARPRQAKDFIVNINNNHISPPKCINQPNLHEKNRNQAP